MKSKSPKWPLAPLILCIILCAGLVAMLSGRALAADCGECPASGITVEITPPTGKAVKSAEVGFSITDSVGAGFASAKVKLGMDGDWHDVTKCLEKWEDRYTGRITITDNCAVTVRVTGNDGAVYEKMCYINCFEHGSQIYLPGTGTAQAPTNAPANTKPGDGGSAGGTVAVSPSTPPASASTDQNAQPDTTYRSPTALTPDGQGTVVDNVTSENSKEFFTISTPNENIFYLIIDKEREDENVYFLNAVTERDLMALAEKDGDSSATTSAIPEPKPVCTCVTKCEAGAVNTACPVCILSLKDCDGTAPVPVADPKPEQPKQPANVGTVVIVLLAMLAVGGAGWYIKIYKPKHDMADVDDLDDLTGDDDGPAVNEDEQPEYGARQVQDEPMYPSYRDDEPEEPDDY